MMFHAILLYPVTYCMLFDCIPHYAIIANDVLFHELPCYSYPMMYCMLYHDIFGTVCLSSIFHPNDPTLNFSLIKWPLEWRLAPRGDWGHIWDVEMYPLVGQPG